MATRRYPAIDLSIAAATVTAVTVMLMSFRSTIDDDLWLHLRIGAELRAGQRFGHLPDPLVVIADRPYTPTQWLSEVSLSVIHDVSGVWGIHLVRALGVAALVLITVATGRLVTSSTKAAVVTFLVIFGTSAAWAERPQLAGLVLHAGCLYVWIHAWKRDRSPWPAGPLLWLWACLHGTWILGLGVCLIGAGVITMTSGARSRAARRSLLVALGSTIAVLLTPAGPGLITQPFVVSEAAQQVSEWQAPTPNNPTFVASILLVAVAAATLGLRRRGSLATAVFGVAGLALSLYTVRTVAFGAVLTGAAAAIALGTGRETAIRLSRRFEVGVWLAAGVLTMAGTAAVSSPRSQLNDPHLVKAVETLPAGTHIAVDPGVSGWVLFHAPTVKPLRDLRAEVYSTEAAEAFHAFTIARPGWETYLVQTAVHAALVPRDSPLAKALATQGWVMAVSQDDYALFVPGSSNQPLRNIVS